MRKTLDYERIININTGDVMGYYTEGHVEKDEFAYTILEEEEDQIQVDQIQHGYMMQTDLDENDCIEYARCLLYLRRDHCDGWLPATFYEYI